MLGTFKSLNIQFSDLLLRQLQAFISFKEFHEMFNCLLNPSGTNTSSHQEWGEVIAWQLSIHLTHTMTTVIILVHSKCVVQHISSVLKPSLFFKTFALESARGREPLNRAPLIQHRLWTAGKHELAKMHAPHICATDPQSRDGQKGFVARSTLISQAGLQAKCWRQGLMRTAVDGND